MRRTTRNEWIVVFICLIVFIAGLTNFMVERTRSAQATIANTCLYNLSQIDAACTQVARSLMLPSGAVLPLDAVARELKHQKLPSCPAGGQYTLPKAGGHPACSVHRGLMLILESK